MEPVKIGIVGCGVIGRHHVQTAVAAENVELVAVADRIPERGEKMAAEFGVPQVYVEGDDLIDGAPVEAVVLALPADGRLSLGLHALGAGKHLLTEKPVGRNAGEVEQLLAAQGDRVAGCCSSRMRFTESAEATAKFLQSGPLGELRLVRCKAISGAGKPRDEPMPDWRVKKAQNGGGILMNWGCYDLDYLLGLLGWTLVPETVFAQCWRVSPAYDFDGYLTRGSDAETHFTALIRCANGVVISFERAEMAAAQTENTWQMYGSHGTLHLHMTAGRKSITCDRAIVGQGVETSVVWEGTDGGDAIHRGPLCDFAAAIREGRTPLTDLRRALVIQRISDAIYASAEAQCSVVV